MNIRTYPLGSMQTNCYLLSHEDVALLIDPGDSADFLLEQVSRSSLTLIGLLATHGHFDHVMAVGEIQASFPDLPLYINPQDHFLLDRIQETARHFLDYEPAVLPIQKQIPLEKGKLTIGPFSFTIIETPGHTPGSCSIYLEAQSAVFSGDTLFMGSVGRTDFSYSSPLELQKSLKKYHTLPESTTIYPGHGESTTIENELTHSPFLSSKQVGD